MPVSEVPSLPQFARPTAEATQGAPQRRGRGGLQGAGVDEDPVATPALQQQPGKPSSTEAAMAQVHGLPFATGRLDFETLGIPGEPQYGVVALPKQIPTQGGHRPQGHQDRQERARQTPLARRQGSEHGQEEEQERPGKGDGISRPQPHLARFSQAASAAGR